jgi:hypothetical protein
MSALDALLAEVRVEAELAVRTEYENTVVSLRSIVKGLEDDLRIANADRDKWAAQVKKLDDRLIRVRDALDKLSATL